ncbi:MAG: anthranilate synthase component I family protein [Planctomycetota bacterium]|nr:anthranilate synthase component I family protein [Planctomycetota bacterium]
METKSVDRVGSGSDVQPTTLLRPLPIEYTPEYCFERLHHLPGCVWLDSSMPQAELGRYSYLGVDPFMRVRIDRPHASAVAQLRDYIAPFRQSKLEGIPPFQGGWMGWFGYELGRSFENLPRAQHNDFNLPVAALGLYDLVLSWDHQREEGWIVSQGFPAQEGTARSKRAYSRLKEITQLLAGVPKRSSTNHGGYELTNLQLAPQYSTRWNNWTSNFAPEQYRSAVGEAVEYIHAGDVFQINLSQRLLTRATASSPELYMHLRKVSPAPFSGYADFGRIQVISSSPERFLRLDDGCIETRPIKGTRPRLSDPTADRGMGTLLEVSEKDRSENVMIVDLMRNDLARVSDYDSIEVESLCGLEEYPFVWHLVSVVRSKLMEACTTSDVLRCTFPGGSITGAPKIRAIEIIAELEPTVRGPYCGSLGYISFAGDMDLSILIRTITACNGWWQAPVGGGIVADSKPDLEEQETWHKAEGMLQAIDSLK